MTLDDLSPEELKTKGEHLAACLRDGHHEDAYYHCLDLLYALHRRSLAEGGRLRELAKEMRKA